MLSLVQQWLTPNAQQQSAQPSEENVERIGCTDAAGPRADQDDELIPGDLLLLVLQHVPPPELASTVPLVCRAWLKAHRDPLLWQHLCDAQLWAALQQPLGLTPTGAPPPPLAPRTSHVRGSSAASDTACDGHAGGSPPAPRLLLAGGYGGSPRGCSAASSGSGASSGSCASSSSGTSSASLARRISLPLVYHAGGAAGGLCR